MSSALEGQKRIKCAEADAYMKNGDKAAKKTLFNWKPEFDVAAAEYDKAAIIYRNFKEYDKAIFAFNKASDCFYKFGTLFNSASALEAIGAIYRDKGEYDQSVEFFRRSKDVFMEADNADRAATALTKAARAVQDTNVNEAVSLYKDALELQLEAERFHMMGDSWRAAVALMAKNERFDDMIETLKKIFPMFDKLEQTQYKNKACLSIIVAQLHKGDTVAADRELQEFQDSAAQFGGSGEGFAAQDLLHAAKEGDQERAKEIVAKSEFTQLENQIARLAKKLPSRIEAQQEDDDLT